MMMRTIAALAAAWVAIALPDAAAPAADSDPAMRKVNPITQFGYVQKAALGDMFEVQSSKLALEKARREEVKSFARMMVRDHSATTDMLKKAIDTAYENAKPEVVLPDRLDPSHRQLMQELETISEDAFDARYLDIQLTAHQDALDLHRSYAETGGNAALRKVAGEIAAVIEKHLGELRPLRKSVGG